MSKNQNNIKAFIISLFIVVAFLIYLIFFSIDNLNYMIFLNEKDNLIEALFSTLFISLITLFISLIGGFVFYILLHVKNNYIRYFAQIIREVIIGTPLLVMIFLVVYVFGIRANISDKQSLGILALSVYMIPYVANSFEAAIEIINEKQFIVMDLYNFSFFEKYVYVIFPQIIKPLLPSMLNNLSNIIKGSALLKIISVTEIAYVITVISNKTYASIEGYLVMWLMYLMITIPLSLIAKYLAKRV